jgi:hypothetical protein
MAGNSRITPNGDYQFVKRIVLSACMHVAPSDGRPFIGLYRHGYGIRAITVDLHRYNGHVSRLMPDM